MQQLALFELKAHKEVQTLQGDWYIPENIIVAAIELMGAIDLDPHSNSKTVPNVPAKLHFTAEDNGLSRPWGPKRRVFLNPPTAPRATGTWVNKLCSEYESGNISEAITLLNAVMDSDWWQRLTPYPACFVHQRLKFGGKQGRNATYPSAVIYLGPNLDSFAEAFGEVGTVYIPFRRKAVPTIPQVSQHGR